MFRSLERRLTKLEAGLGVRTRHAISHDEWVIRREEKRRLAEQAGNSSFRNAPAPDPGRTTAPDSAGAGQEQAGDE